MGYATYLVFILGIVSTLITVYYLAINNIPSLKHIFPSFTLFSVISVMIGVPTAVAIGYVHYKKSGAYRSEVDITIEANPYYFKSTPGKEMLVSLPLSIFMLDAILALSKKLGVDTPELTSEYKRLRELNEKLMKGENI